MKRKEEGQVLEKAFPSGSGGPQESSSLPSKNKVNKWKVNR